MLLDIANLPPAPAGYKWQLTHPDGVASWTLIFDVQLDVKIKFETELTAFVKTISDAGQTIGSDRFDNTEPYQVIADAPAKLTQFFATHFAAMVNSVQEQTKGDDFSYDERKGAVFVENALHDRFQAMGWLPA